MECDFWVGQKVVCLKSIRTVTAGSIYTIRQVGVLYGVPAILLTEVRGDKCEQPRDGFDEDAYRAQYFRPLTDISIFHEIVAKVKTEKRDLMPIGAVR